MSLLLSITIGLYGVLIFILARGTRRLEEFVPDDSPAVHSFSIIVVFRNEIENLSGLVENLKGLAYPADKYEVLLIDDDSEDGSVEEIHRLQAAHPGLGIRLVENETFRFSPKKEAIEKGVRMAKFDWIITTDADCMLQREHLRALDQFLQAREPNLVAGPVICTADDSFLQRFQLLDFLSLQGSTLGAFGMHRPGSLLSPFMCNGANLCYKRKAFIECGGYAGNEHIASGDDVFLLEKMLALDSEKVRFLKSRANVVQTLPKPSWKELLEQRKRWAAKTSSYGNAFGKVVGILVLLANLGLVLGLSMAFAGLITWNLLGLLFLVKLNVDFLLIYRAASFFERTEAMRSFLTSSLLYPFFVLIVSLSSIGGSYRWKGRRFTK